MPKHTETFRENTIYAAVIGFCERLESNGNYRGNGHHLAQKITTMVSLSLFVGMQKEIMVVLSESPQKSKEIADKVNANRKKRNFTNSSQVSAQLLQMSNISCSIVFQKKGRNTLWYHT